MQTSNVYEWTKKEDRRKKILIALKQPLTAKQVSKKTGIPLDTCSYTITKLASRALVTCLNPKARNSRLYWTTGVGRQCRRQLHQDLNLPEKAYDVPSANWDLYGWVCYSHRAAIIRSMTSPMQPSEVKRVLRVHRSNIRISANNIRDVMKLLLEKGLVQKVFIRKKAHPRYELTDSGNQFRQLLMQAEMTF
ncbi:hypothetical protein ES705_31108 [subsurface metagenome]